jgi:tetratricopeptide (TPR) repeat protein
MRLTGFRFESWLLIAALSFSVFGCAAGSGVPAQSPGAAGGTPVNPVEVKDADFAPQAYRILLDPAPSSERTNVLIGVVRRQLQRAASRFDAGNPRIGLNAVLGGLLLVRAGEYRHELIDGGAASLAQSANEVARLGQEGYAAALYSMLATELPAGPGRAEVDKHLRAIDEFGRATQGGGVVQSASASARVAVQRSLLEATPEALNAARERLISWIRRALDSNVSEQPIRSNVERDEVLETYRALRGGTVGLVALYVRHGDPRGVLTAIDEADLERMLPPELRNFLEQAGDERSAEAWAWLYRLFQQASEAAGSVSVFDPELMSAAAFGASLELFRAEPSSLNAAMPLSAQLVKYGMAEVASLVLAGAVTRSSPPEHVSAALEMVLRATIAEDAAGQTEAARRTFAAAEKLVALAESRGFVGRVTPGPARLRYVMAAIETRHAELERALPLLQLAVAAEPTAEAYSIIASIERQRKRPDAALAALDRVLELARRGGDVAAEAEALIQRFEVLRDAGRMDDASKALDAALIRIVEAQRNGRPGPSQARVERLLARVLEHYREQAGIHRATARAYEAANGDVRQIAATVLDVSRRSLTLGDLQSARAAAQRAIEASLPSDEIVYVALWLQLLERRLNVPSDGTVEEAYATIDEASGWPSKLRAWARGKISDRDLLGAARDLSQRTEAAFYVAMNQGPANAAAALRDVAGSAAVELMEVTIARDLIAAQREYKLPPAVAVP